MSARDDYPPRTPLLYDKLCDEIDRLRADSKIGDLMALAVIDLVEEKAALQAQLDGLF